MLTTFCSREDFPAWHPNPKGMFSVKSAYALGTKIRYHQNNSNASTSGYEGGGFDLDVPNKVVCVTLGS